MAGRNLTYKTLDKHCAKGIVEPGEAIDLVVDQTMIHDVTGAAAVASARELLQQMGKDRIRAPETVILISDHYVYTKDPVSQRNHEILAEFAGEQGIKHAFLVQPGYGGDRDKVGPSYVGVCHQLMPELGYVLPGRTMFCADSHTCTAGGLGMLAIGVGSTAAGVSLATNKALFEVPKVMEIRFNGKLPDHIMGKDLILLVLQQLTREGGNGYIAEFTGDALTDLSMDGRLTLNNMSTEGNFVTSIMTPDSTVLPELQRRAKFGFRPVYADSDATYHQEVVFDVSSLDSLVAMPHSPDNVKPAKDIVTKIDRVYVGSCTGGKREDFYRFAEKVNGKRVQTEVFIVPATKGVEHYIRTEKIGGRTLFEILRDSGALESTNGELAPAGCNACLGGPKDTPGYLSKPMNVVSTTNRNFEGRMGAKEGQIYLASPLVAAATALTGYVTDPREVK